MRKFCLGKKPPLVDRRTLQFALYLRPQLPAPPASVNYAKAVTRWPMYANDRYGDCTCAAAGHMIQCWRTNSDASPRKPTTNDVVDFYSYFTTPGPENGVEMLRVLRHWRSTGLADDRITAYTQLRAKNIDDVKQSIYLFGACYIGVVLPKFITNADNPLTPHWALPTHVTHGNGTRDPDGGHCIPAFAYDDKHLYVVTWGTLKAMTWDFYLAYVDEAYAVLSTDWLKGGRTPKGFDIDQLRTDLHAL
jgi:hypothetical protein